MSTIQPGDFNSLPLDSLSKEMLTDAYNTVTELDLWWWLKHPAVPGENGFMFSQAPQISEISKKMKFTAHSGSSFGFTMRVIEAIAKNGWEWYTEKVNDSNTCPCRRASGETGWCGVAGGGVPACDH